MALSASVLNVDDYDPARYAKTRLLRNAGFIVVEAKNASETFAALLEQHFWLVLLDVRLPDMDGRDVCRIIRQNPASKNVHVVHISAAFITPEDVASGMANGADGYITAPFEPADLIKALRALVH